MPSRVVLPPSSVGEMTLSGLLVTLDLTSDGDHLNRSGFSGKVYDTALFQASKRLRLPYRKVN